MQKIDHAAIIAAYLSRLTLADLEVITDRARAATHAGLNLGTRAQIDAHAGLYAAVCNAVGNLLPHDLANLDRIITRAKAKGANHE